MTFTMIILRELLRVYILGLWAMFLISLFTPVSWVTIAGATSWLSIVVTPLVLGVYVDVIVMIIGTAAAAGTWVGRKIKEKLS